MTACGGIDDCFILGEMQYRFYGFVRERIYRTDADSRVNAGEVQILTDMTGVEEDITISAGAVFPDGTVGFCRPEN